jgi:hypothetical protein
MHNVDLVTEIELREDILHTVLDRRNTSNPEILGLFIKSNSVYAC